MFNRVIDVNGLCSDVHYTSHKLYVHYTNNILYVHYTNISTPTSTINCNLHIHHSTFRMNLFLYRYQGFFISLPRFCNIVTEAL